MNTQVHKKVLSLTYYAIVIFDQFFSSKAHFPKVKGITDALKNNAYDQNDYTVSCLQLGSYTSAAIDDCNTKNVVEFVSRELPMRHSTYCPAKNILDMSLAVGKKLFLFP